MFLASAENIVEKLAKEYSLDDMDKAIISSYLQLSDSERAAVKKYITTISDNVSASRQDLIEADIKATDKKLSEISIPSTIE